NGAGVLNRIFFYQNQIETSEDRLLYQKISQAFNNISSGYRFEINIIQHDQLSLNFSLNNSLWRSAADCGLGLQDFLVILFFAIGKEYDVLLLEEPENHMHPEMQRRLLHFLKNETDKQYFISTHSNIFLDTILVDKVFLTRYTDSIEIDDA